MSTALLDPLKDQHAVAQDGHDLVFTGQALGRQVVVSADRPVPTAALEHLLAQMNEQWDVRRRRSDLSRLSNRPTVVLAVSPLTLLLVRHTRAALRLLEGTVQGSGPRHVVLDLRHGQVGLDPTAAAAALRLAPAVAVDVLTDFCLSTGAGAGYVRAGDLLREFGDTVPAWLQHVAGGSSGRSRVGARSWGAPTVHSRAA